MYSWKLLDILPGLAAAYKIITLGLLLIIIVQPMI